MCYAAVSSLPTGLYNPKAFITHAALLDQACAHCPKFPTAASRRSLDRVSVPVWLIILSDQLSVLGLVGRYPANYLMGRGLISRRHPCEHRFLSQAAAQKTLSGISPPFGRLFQTMRQIVHALLTRAPLYSLTEANFLARLACVRHAASVRSEPGSNSPLFSEKLNLTVIGPG